MFRQLSIGMVAALLLCSTAWAQEGGLRADLVKDWAAQKERLVALAQAMPAEKYEFKATPEQRSFGEQMHHLGQANLNLFSPEQDAQILQEAGFKDVELFYAAFTWRGWIAYA